MTETKSAPLPRRKSCRWNKNSHSAATSSNNDEKMLNSDTASIDKNKVTPSDRVQKQSHGTECVKSQRMMNQDKSDALVKSKAYIVVHLKT
jgi:copper oxidase (laccase) domain-containing protein